MKALEITQLDRSSTENTISKLQQLLADFQIYYTNLRGFHWNIKGNSFFTLHAKFEEMYDDAADKVDEIAERILMLDGTPANRFSDYLKIAQIKEVNDITSADGAVKSILESLKQLISQERDINSSASDAGDEATAALMSDYLREQEKLIWMLTAYLG